MARRNNKSKTAATETVEAPELEATEANETVDVIEDAPEGLLNTGELDSEDGDVTADDPMFANNGDRDAAVDDAVEFVDSQGSARDLELNVSGENNMEAISAAMAIGDADDLPAGVVEEFKGDGYTARVVEQTPSQMMEMTRGLSALDPSTEFLERTCGSCLFQKKGKCLVGPATIDKSGDVGANNIYSAFTEYRSVAKKVTPKRDYNNETHEEYEERAEAQTDYEFNDACGQYVGKPVVIKTTSEEMAALMVSSTS